MVSDEELLVASVGDEEAFAAFYRRNARPLAGYLMGRTGDAELAADLTAETFAAALAARRRFDSAKGPATGWLYGIARHKLARTLRHGRVEDRARRTLGMAPLALDDEAIELVLTTDGDVVQLLQRLPADQRAAIEAHVVDGQEYEQIAAAMTDFFDDLERELRRAHRRDTEKHARSRLFDLRRLPGLPTAGRRPLVALAVVVALVAVVLAVGRVSDIERPAAPRPQPTANADTPPVWTPQEQRMDALRERASRDEKPDGLSARQVANRWAQLFASGEEIRTFPATDSPGMYMSQPAEALTRCMDDAVVVQRPIEGCTPPSAEFRKSFQGGVERIVIRGNEASATFTNGEVVELGRGSAPGTWMISKVGESPDK